MLYKGQFVEYGWSEIEADESEVDRLRREAGISYWIARILVNRGIKDNTEAQKYLNPSLSDLHDPFELPDMEKSAKRIAEAVKTGQTIFVHGDYDLDGVTSTALLVRTLKKLGGKVEYKIPHRKKDGYDIKPESVVDAHRKGVDLILTCDCGTTAVESAKAAATLGIDMIITDHHEPGQILPDAFAVINPKRTDSKYPFTELAGVGVALKTAQAVATILEMKPESVLNAYIDLAALGTVGDVAPLLEENRPIVRYGLDAFSRSKKIGLQAAIRHTGYVGKAITPYFVGFVLGPRMNAVGRMHDATLSLNLLLTGDIGEAEKIVVEMEEHNLQRRKVQDDILREAEEMIGSMDIDSLRVLILAKPGWNPGVVGIVAGRLCETYGRPTILLNEDEATGILHGSARSTPTFNMKAALDMCAPLLGRYGGHAGAAGVSLKKTKLDDFVAEMNQIAAEMIPEEEVGPKIDVDCILAASDIDMELAENMSILEPFGFANPEPVFASCGMEVTHCQQMGADNSHLKLFLAGDDVKPLECVAFRWGASADSFPPGSVVDVCYNLRINEFNGNRSLQMMAVDIRRVS